MAAAHNPSTSALVLLFALLLSLLVVDGFIVPATTAGKTHTVRCGSNSNSRLSMSSRVPTVPYFLDKMRKQDNYVWMDIYNALGRDRTLFVGRYLDDEACNQLIASLVWLQGQNEKEPITMYFNSPGAQTKPALAVFDVMKRMKCPIITINAGLVVGIGALLCAAGTPGRRCILPNARFLMSRTGLDDGIEGQAADIRLHVMEVLKDNKRALSELSALSGQPEEKLQKDLKRDFYLTAAEAAAYGIVDEVMLPNSPIKVMQYRGEDDDVVGFGHFCEVRKLKEGPSDKVFIPTAPEDDDAFNEYAAREMAQKAGLVKKGRPPKADRFANSRLKPPGHNKKKPPKDRDDSWKSNKNMFP